MFLRIIGSKEPAEGHGDGCAELHRLVGHRMVEAKYVGMEAQASDRIIAIAVFDVATDRMPHVGGVHAYLVLASRLQFEFHERVLSAAVERIEVGDGQFAVSLPLTAVGDIGPILFEPAGDGALVLLHHAREHCHVAAVIDRVVPVLFQFQLSLLILGIDHQSAGVAVEAVHHVSGTMLSGLLEVFVQHRLDVQRAVTGGHRENPHVFLHHDEIRILVDDLHIMVFKREVAFCLADGNLHPCFERIVVSCDRLAVDLNAAPLQCGFDFGMATVEMGEQPVQQLGIGLNRVVIELFHARIVCRFLFFSLPDGDDLVSDGDDVADAHQGKETESEEDSRQHRTTVDIGEERLDDTHVVVTNEVERAPGNEQHTGVESDGEQLVGPCDIIGAVADEQQVFEFR